MCTMPECDQQPVHVQIDTNVALGTTSTVLRLCPICDTRRCGTRVEVTDARLGTTKHSPCSVQVFDRFAKRCPRGHDLSLD